MLTIPIILKANRLFIQSKIVNLQITLHVYLNKVYKKIAQLWRL